MTIALIILKLSQSSSEPKKRPEINFRQNLRHKGENSKNLVRFVVECSGNLFTQTGTDKLVKIERLVPLMSATNMRVTESAPPPFRAPFK